MNSAFTYLDRNRAKIEIGRRCRVRFCSGRYGQTSTVTGTLVRVTGTCDAVVRLEHPYTNHSDRFGSTAHKAGSDYTVPGVFHLDRQHPKTLIAHHRHHDFEHGHETHLTQLPAPDPAAP